jgi:hypothetical protein
MLKRRGGGGGGGALRGVAEMKFVGEVAEMKFVKRVWVLGFKVQFLMRLLICTILRAQGCRR